MKYIILSVIGCLAFVNPAEAQKKKLQGAESFSRIETGTKIWSGYFSFMQNKDYRIMPNGSFQRTKFSTLDANVRFVSLINSKIGIGLQGGAAFYLADKFQSVELRQITAGPLFRFYPWQNEQTHFYMQTGILLGYDTALADVDDAGYGSGFRFRPDLTAGLTFRLSNRIGIFTELSQKWEGGQDNGFDSKGIHFKVGIQLFKF